MRSVKLRQLNLANSNDMLTHWSLVMLICFSELGHHWLRPVNSSVSNYCPYDALGKCYNWLIFESKEINQLRKYRLQCGCHFVQPPMCPNTHLATRVLQLKRLSSEPEPVKSARIGGFYPEVETFTGSDDQRVYNFRSEMVSVWGYYM